MVSLDEASFKVAHSYLAAIGKIQLKQFAIHTTKVRN